MTTRSDFAHFTPFRVRYNETDAQGVVFYGNYAIYYDCAITEYLRGIGYDYKNQVRDTGTDFHIVKLEVEYAAPLRFDDEIEVGVRVDRLGRASLSFETAVFLKGQDEPSSIGHVTWVNADQSTGKSAPVPEKLRGLIEESESIATAAG